MKIFRIDDCDWWIGPDAATVLAAVKDEYGSTDEDLQDFHELDDDQLDRLKFVDTDEDERTVGEPRTFREQLAIEVAEGGNFPRLFATTEF
ncbi:hypothetical protein GIY21_00805 [Xanthomonas sontii]|uniref:Uncharacterized protein n=1 Tax=Xanthomonas sontii TaxID=2650745 RepID=A0A6N7Q6B2_9XANT|nr:hypothetical protein [Xanthomonas sontii]MRG98826.1 hypothetical protein [Xanthomonas sontii]MRH73383.1 hypothetical protein [Xanthomonas sontii]